MEIKPRTRVIGIFPYWTSLLRMIGALPQEQDDGGRSSTPLRAE
jgi:hypothetical protein